MKITALLTLIVLSGCGIDSPTSDGGTVDAGMSAQMPDIARLGELGYCGMIGMENCGKYCIPVKDSVCCEEDKGVWYQTNDPSLISYIDVDTGLPVVCH